jgi:hypothetical protein
MADVGNDDRDRAFVASLVATELLDPRIVKHRIQAISPHWLTPSRKRVAVSLLRYLEQRRAAGP